jgi:hypothetical protein
MRPKINATKMRIKTDFDIPSRKLSLGGGGETNIEGCG